MNPKKSDLNSEDLSLESRVFLDLVRRGSLLLVALFQAEMLLDDDGSAVELFDVAILKEYGRKPGK